MADVKIKSLFSWSFIDSLGVEGIAFAAGIILARLLSPEEYGICGLLYVFIAICQGIVDGGFGSALIQSSRKDTAEADRNTIFDFNIITSAVCYVIMWVSSPMIAEFYHNDLLSSVLRVMSLIIVINAFSLVQRSILLKELRVKELSIINLVSVITSSVGGCIAAFLGCGVWSLLISRVGRVVVNAIGVLWCCSWYPKWKFSMESFCRLGGYAVKVLCISFVENVFNNLIPMIIGKKFTISDVGLYNRADSLRAVPCNLIQGVISKICFPFFAKYQHDRAMLTQYYLLFIFLTSMLMFLAMGGLAVVARPLTILLLTEKWLPCVVLLQLLCCFGWTYPIQAINNALLNGIGRVGVLLTITIIQRVLIVIGIILAVILARIEWLIVFVGIAQFVNCLISVVCSSYFLKFSMCWIFKHFFLMLTAVLLSLAVAYVSIPYLKYNILQVVLLPIEILFVFGGLMLIMYSKKIHLAKKLLYSQV